MPRKEDKLRPYRVDYFDINEMQLPDKALVQSVIVRAVTSEEAAKQAIEVPAARGRVLIRSYRFYKKLGARKQDVYKPIEDLFTANKAVTVMATVEAYRSKTKDDVNARRSAELEAAQCPFGYPSGPNGTAHNCAIHKVEEFAPKQYGVDFNLGNGHVTRYSDSSLYDEVCTNCGATDASGKLDIPCPNAPKTTVVPTVQQQVIDVYQTKVPDDVPLPASGPQSVATQAALADLDGMTAHDAHEQTMDTFVPTPLADVKPENCTPVPNTRQTFTFPDRPVVPTKPATFDNGHWSGCKCASCVPAEPAPNTVGGLGFQDPALPEDWQNALNKPAIVLTSTDTGVSWKKLGLPLWVKLGIFAVSAVVLLLIVNSVLSCHR